MDRQQELVLLDQQLAEFQTARGAFEAGDDDRFALTVAIQDLNERRATLQLAEQTFTCVVCEDDVEGPDAIRVKCGHSFCRSCFKTTFTRALTIDTEYPVTCCGREIPLARTSDVLSLVERTRYKNRKTELESETKLYCADPACNWFINPKSYADPTTILVRCGKCRKVTCKTCKTQHTAFNECPSEIEANRAVREFGKAQGWRECNRCHAIVERIDGCPHMT